MRLGASAVPPYAARSTSARYQSTPPNDLGLLRALFARLPVLRIYRIDPVGGCETLPASEMTLPRPASERKSRRVVMRKRIEGHRGFEPLSSLWKSEILGRYMNAPLHSAGCNAQLGLPCRPRRAGFSLVSRTADSRRMNRRPSASARRRLPP